MKGKVTHPKEWRLDGRKKHANSNTLLTKLTVAHLVKNIPHLWAPKFNYCVLKSPPLDSNLSHLCTVHTISSPPPPCLSPIYINIISQSTLGSSKQSLSLELSSRKSKPLSSFLYLRDAITNFIFIGSGEQFNHEVCFMQFSLSSRCYLFLNFKSLSQDSLSETH